MKLFKNEAQWWTMVTDKSLITWIFCYFYLHSFGNSVDMRSFYQFIWVGTDGLVSMIIGHDEQKIWSFIFFSFEMSFH